METMLPGNAAELWHTFTTTVSTTRKGVTLPVNHTGQLVVDNLLTVPVWVSTNPWGSAPLADQWQPGMFF